MSSPLCSKVANEGIANMISSFNTCYKDTSLIGVYGECESDSRPRLMEVTMEVGDDCVIR